MLAELDQITSILSNVCVILITAWLVIKSWQFNPKRAGLFGPISQPGGRIPPPKISETD